jgi:hypothetical protein
MRAMTTIISILFPMCVTAVATLVIVVVGAMTRMLILILLRLCLLRLKCSSEALGPEFQCVLTGCGEFKDDSCTGFGIVHECGIYTAAMANDEALA